MESAASIISRDEDARMAAVHRYDILDTPRDGAFDRVTELAARLFGVPISIVSIVDEDRIWFKSHHGIDVQEIGRDPGLCASAILRYEPLVVPDASVDPSTLANPLVAGDFGLRFYVGVPLTTRDGYNLGTICVIDTEPREVGEDQVATLEHLAAIVVHELELRIATRAIVEGERANIALKAARRGLEAAEQERARWARELHDETLQSLGALHMLLTSGLTTGGPLEATVTEAAGFVKDEIVKLRHLIAELRPAVLDHVGLEAALESLGHKLRIVDGLEVMLDVRIPEGERPADADAESMLYRVVQEALANVANHSGARSVRVAVRSCEQGLEVIVTDDGVGFEVGASSGGFGLLGMRERATLVGGELELRSTLGVGTTVRFVMPSGDMGAIDGAQGSSSP
jgi:signal transduction histidine kinase